MSTLASRIVLGFGAATIAAALPVPTALGQPDPNYYWIGSGSWLGPENWEHLEWDPNQQEWVWVAGVPPCDTPRPVVIDFGGPSIHSGACALSVDLGGILDVYAGGTLTVDNELAASGLAQVKQYAGSSANINILTLESSDYLLYGGTLYADGIGLGYFGPGTFWQSGGVNQVSGDVGFGNAYSGVGNSMGTYVLVGGTLTAGRLVMGVMTDSVGYFIQTAGTSTIAGDIFLGWVSESHASYELSGDPNTVTLSAYRIRVGESGEGTFDQAGGRVEVGWLLYVGEDPGAIGTYELSGDASLSAVHEYIGYEGTGTFVQTGGTNTIAGDLVVGYYDSDGTYELSGDGSLSADYEWVGYRGTGTFVQTGGTNTIAGDLILGGVDEGGDGTYDLSGSGSLSAGNETIGVYGPGTFVQTGGTNAVGQLWVGDFGGGAYHLSGDAYLFADVEIIGHNGIGTFVQTGGTNTIAGNLVLGEYYSDGTYGLGGGALSVGQSVTVGGWGTGGTGTLQVSGATCALEARSLTIGDGRSVGLLDLAAPGANIAVADLVFGTHATLSAVAGSVIDVSDSIINYSTDESALAGLENLNLSCEGVPTYVEVAGYDDGPDSPYCSDNFSIDTLTVNGVVILVDDVDNGNRGGTYGWNEALYVNNLVIAPDGILYTNGLNLYVACEIPPSGGGLCLGSEKGDFDRDCDVDLADFEQSNNCFGGPDVPVEPECNPLDFDFDEDVDLIDFAGFQVVFTGD